MRSNTFCACLEGAYTIGKTIDTLHDRTYELSFLYRNRVDAIKYFCAFLEGAYTIDKMIDTLHGRALRFYALNMWPLSRYLVANIVAQIARRRRKILLFKIIVPCSKTRF